MTKLKIVTFIGFLVMFGAGLVVGMYADRWMAEKREHLPYLTRELDLNAAQSEQVQRIWSAVRDGWREQSDGRRALRKERDDALAALIKPEQKPEYDAIEQRYTSAVADLTEQGRKTYDKAVEQIRSVLTAEQRAKYDDLLKKQAEARAQAQTRRSDDRGTTRPATTRSAGG